MKLDQLCFLGAIFLTGTSLAALRLPGKPSEAHWNALAAATNYYCYQNYAPYWQHPCRCPIRVQKPDGTWGIEHEDFCKSGIPPAGQTFLSLSPSCTSCPNKQCADAENEKIPCSDDGHVWTCPNANCEGMSPFNPASCFQDSKIGCTATYGCSGGGGVPCVQ